MRRYTLLAIGLVLSDQITKILAQSYLNMSREIVLIPQALALQLVHNYGAAYGIFQHQRLFLVIVSIAVLAFCWINRKKLAQSTLAKIGLYFLMAGTLGNLLSRVIYGYVIDFIVIYIIPVFNIADICINIGIIGLILDMFISSDNHKNTSPQ